MLLSTAEDIPLFQPKVRLLPPPRMVMQVEILRELQTMRTWFLSEFGSQSRRMERPYRGW